MADSRIAAFDQETQNVLQHLHGEYMKLQTGRANAAIVEHLMVEAYGQRMELRTLAGIAVQDAKTIVIQPWDTSILGNIEKALQQVNLGTNPVNDGIVIRINLPPMTEERRNDLQKIVAKLAEEARIAIRQHRQHVHDAVKVEKDDDVKETLMGVLQKVVDKANENIEEAKRKKEEEVMKV